jgi:ElaB/YqjD/DUF883 family membrane-anchored ribosome-binding protein
MSKSHGQSQAAKHVKETASDAAGAAETLAGNIQQVASNTAEHLGDLASDLFDQGQDKASEVLETVSEHVQKNPGSSLLMAAGIGFLVGALLTKK